MIWGEVKGLDELEAPGRYTPSSPAVHVLDLPTFLLDHKNPSYDPVGLG